MENLWEIVIVAIVLLCLVISILALLLFRQNKGQLMQSVGLINELYEQDKANAALIGELKEEIEQLQRQYTKMQKVALKNNEKVLFCESEITRLAEQDPVLKMYSKAARLVAAGEDIEEISQASGLPKAEIEVLYSINKNSKPT